MPINKWMNIEDVVKWSEVKWSLSVASDSLRPHGHQVPPSNGFSRQEYWSGLPFPSPGNFPTQGSNPGLPHCRQTLYRLSHQWSQDVVQFSSVHFSCSVVSDSLQPYESQHARPPCPSPTPGVHADSHPSSPWCHPAISSSVVPFSSCPQSLPASESFPMSQLFAWGRQSTGVSASASFLPKKS